MSWLLRSPFSIFDAVAMIRHLGGNPTECLEGEEQAPFNIPFLSYLSQRELSKKVDGYCKAFLDTAIATAEAKKPRIQTELSGIADALKIDLLMKLYEQRFNWAQGLSQTQTWDRLKREITPLHLKALDSFSSIFVESEKLQQFNNSLQVQTQDPVEKLRLYYQDFAQFLHYPPKTLFKAWCILTQLEKTIQEAQESLKKLPRSIFRNQLKDDFLKNYEKYLDTFNQNIQQQKGKIKKTAEYILDHLRENKEIHTYDTFQEISDLFKKVGISSFKVKPLAESITDEEIDHLFTIVVQGDPLSYKKWGGYPCSTVNTFSSDFSFDIGIGPSKESWVSFPLNKHQFCSPHLNLEWPNYQGIAPSTVWNFNLAVRQYFSRGNRISDLKPLVEILFQELKKIQLHSSKTNPDHIEKLLTLWNSELVVRGEFILNTIANHWTETLEKISIQCLDTQEYKPFLELLIVVGRFMDWVEIHKKENNLTYLATNIQYKPHEFRKSIQDLKKTSIDQYLAAAATHQQKGLEYWQDIRDACEKAAARSDSPDYSVFVSFFTNPSEIDLNTICETLMKEGSMDEGTARLAIRKFLQSKLLDVKSTSVLETCDKWFPDPSYPSLVQTWKDLKENEVLRKIYEIRLKSQDPDRWPVFNRDDFKTIPKEIRQQCESFLREMFKNPKTILQASSNLETLLISLGNVELTTLYLQRIAQQNVSDLLEPPISNRKELILTSHEFRTALKENIKTFALHSLLLLRYDHLRVLTEFFPQEEQESIFEIIDDACFEHFKEHLLHSHPDRRLLTRLIEIYHYPVSKAGKIILKNKLSTFSPEPWNPALWEFIVTLSNRDPVWKPFLHQWRLGMLQQRLRLKSVEPSENIFPVSSQLTVQGLSLVQNLFGDCTRHALDAIYENRFNFKLWLLQDEHFRQIWSLCVFGVLPADNDQLFRIKTFLEQRDHGLQIDRLIEQLVGPLAHALFRDSTGLAAIYRTHFTDLLFLSFTAPTELPPDWVYDGLATVALHCKRETWVALREVLKENLKTALIRHFPLHENLLVTLFPWEQFWNQNLPVEIREKSWLYKIGALLDRGSLESLQNLKRYVDENSTKLLLDSEDWLLSKTQDGAMLFSKSVLSSNIPLLPSQYRHQLLAHLYQTQMPMLTSFSMSALSIAQTILQTGDFNFSLGARFELYQLLSQAISALQAKGKTEAENLFIGVAENISRFKALEQGWFTKMTPVYLREQKARITAWKEWKSQLSDSLGIEGANTSENRSWMIGNCTTAQTISTLDPSIEIFKNPPFLSGLLFEDLFLNLITGFSIPPFDILKLKDGSFYLLRFKPDDVATFDELQRTDQLRIEPRSFDAYFIFQLIWGLSHDHPIDYKLYPDQEGKKSFILYRSASHPSQTPPRREHSDFWDVQDRSEIQMDHLSFLYACHQEMEHPLDPETIERITQLNPRLVLETLVTGWNFYSHRLAHCFSSTKDVQMSFSRDSRFSGIPWSELRIKHFIQRLSFLQKLLQKNRSATRYELLQAFDPIAARFYQVHPFFPSNPLRRYESLKSAPKMTLSPARAAQIFEHARQKWDGLYACPFSFSDAPLTLTEVKEEPKSPKIGPNLQVIDLTGSTLDIDRLRTIAEQAPSLKKIVLDSSVIHPSKTGVVKKELLPLHFDNETQQLVFQQLQVFQARGLRKGLTDLYKLQIISPALAYVSLNQSVYFRQIAITTQISHIYIEGKGTYLDLISIRPLLRDSWRTFSWKLPEENEESYRLLFECVKKSFAEQFKALVLVYFKYFSKLPQPENLCRIAIKYDSGETLALILNALPSPTRFIEENHLLYHATEGNKISCVKTLLNFDPSHYPHELDGKYPAYLAYLHEHFTLHLLLLPKTPPEILSNPIDEHGSTLLHLVLVRNQLSIAEILIKQGVDLTIPNDNGVTPLHQIMEHNLAHLWKISQTTANPANNRGFRPLHYAAEKGSLETAKLWFDNLPSEMRKIVLDQESHNKTTPLHIATYHGRLLFVEWLISQGADISKVNEEGHTALNLAILNNQEEVTEFLLRTPERAKTLYLPLQETQNPFEIAIQQKNTFILNLLIERALPHHVIGKGDFWPLVATLLTGNLILLDDLFKKGFTIGSDPKTKLQFWHVLIAVGDPFLFEKIKKAFESSPPSSSDSFTTTPLLLAGIAAYFGRKDYLDLFLSYSNIQDSDPEGYTVLHYAILGKQYPLIQTLMEKGANPLAETNAGENSFELSRKQCDETALQILRKNQAVCLYERLKARGNDKKLQQTVIDFLTPPLTKDYWTTEKSFIQHILSFLNKNRLLSEYKKFFRDKDLIHFALKTSSVPLLKELNLLDSSTRPLHESTSLEITQLLLQKGASPTLQDSQRKTPLHCAIEKGQLHIAKFLLSVAPQAKAMTDAEGNTPFHCLSALREEFSTQKVNPFLDLFKQEIKNYDLKFFFLNYLDDHFFPLLEKKETTSAKDLIDKNLENKSPQEIFTFFESQFNFQGKFKWNKAKGMCEYIPSINQPNHKQQTPLHLAVPTGDLPFIKALLANGADPTKPDQNGWLPIHHAAAHGELAILEELYGQVDALTKKGESVLDLAIKNRQKNIVKYICAEKGYPFEHYFKEPSKSEKTYPASFIQGTEQVLHYLNNLIAFKKTPSLAPVSKTTQPLNYRMSFSFVFGGETFVTLPTLGDSFCAVHALSNQFNKEGYLQSPHSRQEIRQLLDQERKKGPTSPLWNHFRLFFIGLCNSQEGDEYDSLLRRTLQGPLKSIRERMESDEKNAFNSHLDFIILKHFQQYLDRFENEDYYLTRYEMEMVAHLLDIPIKLVNDTILQNQKPGEKISSKTTLIWHEGLHYSRCTRVSDKLSLLHEWTPKQFPKAEPLVIEPAPTIEINLHEPATELKTLITLPPNEFIYLNQRYKILKTPGDGFCAIHALLGESYGDGVHKSTLTRVQVVERLKNEFYMKERLSPIWQNFRDFFSGILLNSDEYDLNLKKNILPRFETYKKLLEQHAQRERLQPLLERRLKILTPVVIYTINNKPHLKTPFDKFYQDGPRKLDLKGAIQVHFNAILKWLGEYSHKDIISCYHQLREIEETLLNMKNEEEKALDHAIRGCFHLYLQRFLEDSYYLTQLELEMVAKLFDKRIEILTKPRVSANKGNPLHDNTIVIYHEGLHFSRCQKIVNEKK